MEGNDMAKKELYTEIEIDAPPEKLWQVLTDFRSFPEWNPFIRQITGLPKEGEKLNVHLKPIKGREMTFKPTVMKSIPNHEFRWLGKIPGFHGEHIFEIKSNKKGVKFIQREVFTGFLVPFVGKKVVRDTHPAFEKMNRALKMRVEKMA
jgi:hypothetical protein